MVMSQSGTRGVWHVSWRGELASACENGEVALLGATLSVTLIGAGLVLLGFVIVAVTVSFWRASAEDPSVLAPLEVMADRRFARADDRTRSRMLANYRAEDAPDEGGEEIVWSSPRGARQRSIREPETADETASMGSFDPLIGSPDRPRGFQE